MTAAAICRETVAAGVTLSLSAPGTIKVTGEQAVARWLTTIKENKAGIVALLAETASKKPFEASCWLIHFADRNPLEVAFSPAATHAEVPFWYQDAVAAEPFTPTVRSPASSMTGDEERAVLRWLASIGEQDAATSAATCAMAPAWPTGVGSAICGYRPVTGIQQRCLAFQPAHQSANSL
jgi:hypothetical protein